MALALGLRDLLPGLEGPPQVFDPAFTPADMGLMAAVGFEVRWAPGGDGSAKACGEDQERH